MKTPDCVGIILDGNRRWAREHDLPTLKGHKKGFENVEPIALHLSQKGVKHLVVFAFSTENWDRSNEEVAYLLDLFQSVAKDISGRLHEKRVAVRFCGQRDRFSQDLQDAMSHAERNSPENAAITVWWCLSYGGRADIVQAAQKAADAGGISEDSINNNLWTAGMPDPDIIIRTGGQMRLSNFLLWQGSYSELFFTKTYWPAFTSGELDSILEEYSHRERRMGK